MKTNPLKEGALTVNSVGIGTVTRKMLRDRAIELAFTDGRTEKELSPSDWEQANRELTGATDIDPKEEVLESVPDSERWDPVPGSTGQKVEAAASEDEDAEGRSDNEILTEQGISEAELDEARAASKQAL
jgi:hypothetical protein